MIHDTGTAFTVCPSEVYALKKLQILCFRDTPLTAVANAISQMESLLTIDISNTDFGQFPEALIWIESLKEVYYAQEDGRKITYDERLSEFSPRHVFTL